MKKKMVERGALSFSGAQNPNLKICLSAERYHCCVDSINLSFDFISSHVNLWQAPSAGAVHINTMVKSKIYHIPERGALIKKKLGAWSVNSKIARSVERWRHPDGPSRYSTAIYVRPITSPHIIFFL